MTILGDDGGHGTALETPPTGIPSPLTDPATAPAPPAPVARLAPVSSSPSAPEAPHGMRVMKRNGTLEPVDVNKIVNAIAKAAEGLRGVDPLRVATRTNTSATFGPFVPVTELDAPSVTERDPYFTADGALLFTQGGKIARALRFNNTWASALAPELGGLAGVRNPVLSADGLEIFFSAPDAGASGNMRIHRAARASTSEKFGAGSQVTELGGTKTYEAPTWLSDDGCHLLLSSDRAGQLDIYYAVRGK